MRTVPEWIGKTDDAKVPPRVKLRVFELYEGRCYITDIKIQAGQAWQCDHVLALCNGGEHRESNLAPVLTHVHKLKTARDVKIKAKTYRMRKRNLGIRKRSSFPCSRDSLFKKKIGTGEVVRR